MLQATVKHFISPKKLADMTYKVQRGKNGDHLLIRQPSQRKVSTTEHICHVGDVADIFEQKRDSLRSSKPGPIPTPEPSTGVERVPTPPPTGEERMLPSDGRYMVQSSSECWVVSLICQQAL